jgi:hypothetical protein
MSSLCDWTGSRSFSHDWRSLPLYYGIPILKFQHSAKKRMPSKVVIANATLSVIDIGCRLRNTPPAGSHQRAHPHVAQKVHHARIRPVSQQATTIPLGWENVVAKSGCVFFRNGNSNPQRAPGDETPSFCAREERSSFERKRSLPLPAECRRSQVARTCKVANNLGSWPLLVKHPRI